MATTKNITMKQFNGTDYDTLYPKTIAAQIPDVFSQSETVNAEMLSKYGLGASGTPNDVFGVLSRFQNGLGNEYLWAKSDDTGIVDYVNSHDPSAYPPAVSDGYTYTALGKLGEKVQIATGSYTGTGTYGISNPCSLTFEFAPKMIMIFGKLDNADNAYFGFWIQGSSGMPIFISRAGSSSDGGVSYGQNASLSENTFSWYNRFGSAQISLNASGQLYSYIAIG